MSNGSPTAYLLWAILACLFLGFLICHLWSYDRFKCLRWGAGRQPGAFKRIMTYSYLATVPLLVVFSVAMTAIKYKEGYVITPDGLIIPKPYALWVKTNAKWILPLYFVFGSAWALEIVTHLEELTFWLFLLNQGPGKREWFESWEFRTWYLGSIIAILGMPIVTLITRRNLETAEAWIFLVGSSASTCTTICFLYVLFRFPHFLRRVKNDGAEPDVVVRLTTFYQLNLVRVFFRFLFTVPLLTLALDGVQGSHAVINDAFWSDFLLMMSGIGCFVSSAITLLIFFPRSIAKESGYKTKHPTASFKTSVVAPSPVLPAHHPHNHQHYYPKNRSTADAHWTDSTLEYDGAYQYSYPCAYEQEPEPPASPSSPTPYAASELDWGSVEVTPLPRRAVSLGPLKGARGDPVASMWLEQRQRIREIAAHEERLQMWRTGAGSSGLHPYVVSFTSPIDLPNADDPLLHTL